MKSYLFNLCKSNSKPLVPAAKLSYLQLVQSKRNRFFNCKILSRKVLFSAGSGGLLTLIFLMLFVQSEAQTTDTTTFPLNDYLYTTSSYPYPSVNNDKINAIDESNFVNVMDYGAKGDGQTLDDDAIANAFKAAQYGVIFPSGKTFLVSKLSRIILTHDITVYAYGATIKMAAFSRYSFLSLEYQSGSYHNNVIWLGGTFDGNKNNQSWPGSPTGNDAWEEDHGRFIGVCYAEFVLFKDVQLLNTVMDGIGIESCKLGVIADSKANKGVRFKYNEVQEQGTYFKFTRVGLKSCYFINLTCRGGSIGTHVSYPENATMDNQTLSVHVNCHFYNQVQNAVHIEDCYKNFFYNCTIGADTGYQYNPSIHLSNRTGIVSIKSCQFKNAKVDFNQAVSLKLGVIDSCQFVSEFKGFGCPLNTFIEGRPTVCINSTFSGRTASGYQAYLKNVRNCTFTNFDSLAVQGGYAVDSSTFINGIKPANLAKAGFVINSTFINVQSSLYKSSPSDNNWKNIYLSYIDILSDNSTYLGRITCGGNTDSAIQSQLALATPASAGATALSSASKKYAVPHPFNFDSTQGHQSVTDMAIKSALSNNVLPAEVIKLYPNPAVEMLHISLNNQVWGKTILTIYDEQGRLVQNKTIDKNVAASVETMNVHSLTSGSYILQISNQHQQASFKFVIAR